MGSRITKYTDVLLKYMDDKARDKNKTKIITDDWNLVRCDRSTTPQQLNGFDCGVLVTSFLFRIAKQYSKDSYFVSEITKKSTYQVHFLGAWLMVSCSRTFIT